MKYDRPITISAGNSRKATSWPAQTLLWSEFAEKLRVPTRGQETLAAYLQLPKSQQDELKDVGGFVAGALKNSRRKAGNVLGRDVVTLDLDSIPAGGTEDVLRRVEGLGCGYAVYSTRKHAPAAPRLRVLLPLNRTASADEYEPIARKAAELIGLAFCDPSTFEASRLMYWPSCCADSQYVYLCADKPFLSAEGVLALYGDWRDMAQWPEVPGAPQLPTRLAAKQGEPGEKPGAVGAFCRIYDIYRAMEELLPGVYEPTDTPDRYTFTAGSTAGGAVVYDGGKFLFSHHATDPCGGKLVNAFDLVRLHLFGDEDDEAKPDTPVNKLPSFVSMSKRALADPAVVLELTKDRYDAAMAGFAEAPAAQDQNWMLALARNSNGNVEKTMDNIWMILENDPLLKGKFALNRFANRGEVLSALPWDARQQRRFWGDNDNHGLYWYIEKVYHVTGRDKIDGALSLHSRKHSFNDIQTYLEGLSWDGTPRLATLFTDYLGAPDTAYTRAVSRKAFVAAVARAMHPGTKFDYMTVLSGPQGIGKSTLLRKMAKGWFTDSLTTFEGKDASELIQGVWIVEVSEMEAFGRSGMNRVKQFLSQQIDRYRAAYGRNVEDNPRRCVFFGTSNSREYLSDLTGNRRFWPVDTGVAPKKKSVFTDLDAEIDQLWAEAVALWKAGETLYLLDTVEAEALRAQEEHREQSPMEGIICDFLRQPVPLDWDNWALDRRRMYWAGQMHETPETAPRAKVCALEIWCEALEQDPGRIKKSDAKEINQIVDRQPGWERMGSNGRFGYCKFQRGFQRSMGGRLSTF